MGFSLTCPYCGKEPPPGSAAILSEEGFFCSQEHIDAYARQKQEKARQAQAQEAAAARQREAAQEAARLEAKRQRRIKMLINLSLTLLFAVILFVFILNPGFYSRMTAPLSRLGFTALVVRQLGPHPFIGTVILLIICGFVFRVLKALTGKKLPIVFACAALFILLGDLAVPRVTTQIRSLIPFAAPARAVSVNRQTHRFVNSDALNIRSGPSSETEMVGTLHKNDRVELLDTSGQWWKIKAGDLEGYVNSAYLRN
jgi:membrane-bound ClpP family serine protease